MVQCLHVPAAVSACSFLLRLPPGVFPLPLGSWLPLTTPGSTHPRMGDSLQDSLGWAAPRGGGTTDTDAPATVGQLITRALGPEAGALGSLPGFAAS